jgi:hypothetical protein
VPGVGLSLGQNGGQTAVVVDHCLVKCPLVYQSEVWCFFLDAVEFADLADCPLLTCAEGDIFLHHSDLDALAFSQAEKLTQLFSGLARELQGQTAILIRNDTQSCGHKGKRSFDSTISAAKKGVIDLEAILGGHQHLDLGVLLLGEGAVFIPDLPDADCVITRLSDWHQLGFIGIIGHRF